MFLQRRSARKMQMSFEDPVAIQLINVEKIPAYLPMLIPNTPISTSEALIQSRYVGKPKARVLTLKTNLVLKDVVFRSVPIGETSWKGEAGIFVPFAYTM